MRALAARLLAIREGGGVAFEPEYDWIVATLLAAHPSDYREVEPLVGRSLQRWRSLRAAQDAEKDEATRSQLRWAYDQIAAVSDVTDHMRERK